MSSITESAVESAALGWFAALGYAIASGPDIAPGELLAERASYGDVILIGRLQSALERINPNVPADAIEEAIRRVLRTESPSLYENNHRFHELLVNGVDYEYRRAGRLGSLLAKPKRS